MKARSSHLPMRRRTGLALPAPACGVPQEPSSALPCLPLPSPGSQGGSCPSPGPERPGCRARLRLFLQRQLWARCAAGHSGQEPPALRRLPNAQRRTCDISFCPLLFSWIFFVPREPSNSISASALTPTPLLLPSRLFFQNRSCNSRCPKAPILYN